MTFVYILLSLLVLTFLIFFHELGHFTVGKLLGFRILGFSIGFGPAVFKFKKVKRSTPCARCRSEAPANLTARMRKRKTTPEGSMQTPSGSVFS